MFRIMAGLVRVDADGGVPTIRRVAPSIEYRWRGPVSDAGYLVSFDVAAGGDRYFEKVTWPPWTGTSSIQVWPAGTSSL
jgi:hypothetical protein